MSTSTADPIEIYQAAQAELHEKTALLERARLEADDDAAVALQANVDELSARLPILRIKSLRAQLAQAQEQAAAAAAEFSAFAEALPQRTAAVRAEVEPRIAALEAELAQERAKLAAVRQPLGPLRERRDESSKNVLLLAAELEDAEGQACTPWTTPAPAAPARTYDGERSEVGALFKGTGVIRR